MYDIVSELNASKTQVFECKQDCGRYLSYHCQNTAKRCIGSRELQDFLYRELASFGDKRHIDILYLIQS